MADVTELPVKAGSTEPMAFSVGAGNLTNLDNLSSAVLYARDVTSGVNHVDGAALSVLDSAEKTLTFDPVDAKNGGGNAFDEPGTYKLYLRATWSDGDITRHPDAGYVTLTVEPIFE